MNEKVSKSEVATLGGGCYWCLEAFYKLIEGVTKVDSGYSGGHTDNPTVNEVYAGKTGHAEVVQVTFDPAVISYHDILEIFFVMHDPTTLNRQGPDVGDEYRSIPKRLRLARPQSEPPRWCGTGNDSAGQFQQKSAA